MRRYALWRGTDTWRAESAEVELTRHGLRAAGTQLGATPLPYRLDYVLDASADFVTRSLRVEVVGDGWLRRLDLRREFHGAWRCAAEAEGQVELPDPGGEVAGLDAARDCDLGYSPLTNLMPVRRHALHERPVALDFTVAWVSVPDLALEVSAQRYEHLRRTGDGGALVRFSTPENFRSDLELDGDGLVVRYPGLAERVG
jgi:hypothetical protein